MDRATSFSSACQVTRRKEGLRAGPASACRRPAVHTYMYSHSPQWQKGKIPSTRPSLRSARPEAPFCPTPACYWIAPGNPNRNRTAPHVRSKVSEVGTADLVLGPQVSGSRFRINHQTEDTWACASFDLTLLSVLYLSTYLYIVVVLCHNHSLSIFGFAIDLSIGIGLLG